MDPHAFIKGHEEVLARFGQWPSFHDGEVHRILLDSTRRDSTGRRYPSIEVEVRGWIMTHEVTEEGLYRCEFDSVVRFLFEHVASVELDGLNHQNVLSYLGLKLLAEADSVQLKVELGHCFGLSGSFVAGKASVLSVTPYTATSAA